MEDVIRESGYLCLGSRLRRLGEQLQAFVQDQIDCHKLPILVAHFPVLMAVHRLGPLSVGELADALGIRQPGVTKHVNALIELGLLDVKPSQNDMRKKTVDLSKAGQDLVSYSEREIWGVIEASVRSAFHGRSGPFLEQLSEVEDALFERPLNRRADRKTPNKRVLK